MSTHSEKKMLRALIVDDSADDADLVVRTLKSGGYDVHFNRVFTENSLREALQSETWDIVITDSTMPGFDAFGSIKVVKGSALDLPILVVSGTVDDEIAVKTMRHGAHDYLLKGNLTRLVPAVEREMNEAKNRKMWRESEDQLRQAQKMEAIGRLAGGIAHDFNNILGIHFMVCDSILSRLPETDEIYKDVDDIRRASEKAADLTRQLLAFSRKQLMEVRVIDLNSVIRDSEKLLRHLIGADIDLRVDLKPGIGAVEADPVQIEQIILNLAVNSRDAMETGGRLSIVSSEEMIGADEFISYRQIPPGKYVSLTVSDTGCGMDVATKAKIFEPFFTTKGQGKGTGLGLSTVYGIVKQSNGFIFVESEVGKGTTFKVIFPVVEGLTEGRFRSAASIRPTEIDGRSVLVLEDQAEFSNILSSILKARGFKVFSPKNGVEALSLIDELKEPLHLLLTDVVMPGESGPEIAEKLIARMPDMKVIFMSGYTDGTVERFDLRNKGFAFLQKPFKTADLYQKINDVFASSGGGL